MWNSITEVLDNAELLISLCVIFEISLFIEVNDRFSRRVLNITLLSLVGILVINAPWVIVPGVHLDARVVFIGLLFLIFDEQPSMIVVLILILYRILIGGDGTLAGVTMMTLAALVGYGWKKLKLFSRIPNSWISLYLLGFLLHGMVLVSFILLPQAIQGIVFSKAWIPVLVVYPLVTVLVGKVLLMQKNRIKDHHEVLKAEKRFRSIFEKANIGISFTDVEGIIMDANATFCEISGYTKEELIGKSFRTITYEDDLSLDEVHLTDLLRGKINNYVIDKRYVRKDGSLVWITLTTSLFQEEGKQILMGSVIDITERKNAEIDLMFQTYHDPLTGLYNRRYFDEHKGEFDSPQFYPLSVTLISINGLPLFNEVFGFAVGDQVMIKGSEILKAHSDNQELIYRMDGDKFMILHPNQNLIEAHKMVQKLREAFGSVTIENITLSISAGHATKNKAHVEIEKIVNIAGDNLKRDKLIDKSSMASKTIDIIMNSLFEKNKREMLHSKRVSQLCERMAIKLDVSENEVTKIKIAGLMHDIGKIGISDMILDKTDKLTELEWHEIQRHCEAGYRILSSADEFSEIAETILCHHERYDGKGYPKGLQGEAIPLFSRIISLADAFDAMMSDRAYRQALTQDKAIKELRLNAGKQFDPSLVEPFIEVILDLDTDLPALDINPELTFNEA